MRRVERCLHLHMFLKPGKVGVEWKPQEERKEGGFSQFSELARCFSHAKSVCLSVQMKWEPRRYSIFWKPTIIRGQYFTAGNDD